MDAQKIMVFTHCCIEGHTSVALIKASFACEVGFKTCVPDNWMELLKKQFKKEEETGEKPFIFITDLNIPDHKRDDPQVQELLDMINKRGNVMLIDHHEKAAWLMDEPRINAFVNPYAKSASHIVLDTLKSNSLSDSRRKELGLDGFIKFPAELSELLLNKTNYHTLKNFDSTIETIDAIDSGQEGYGHIFYVFHSDKKAFITRIADNYSIELSPEQMEQYEEYEKQKQRKVKAFIKKALNGRSRIMKVFKDNRGLTCVKTICPKDSDIRVYDIEKALLKMNLKHDLFIAVRPHERGMPVSIIAASERANAAEKAAEYGGSGHAEAASYNSNLEKEQMVKEKDEYVFGSIKPLAMCDPKTRVNIARRFKIKKRDSFAFAF